MHDQIYASTEMGRALIKWAEPYPLDFLVGELREKDDGRMPADINIERGRVVFRIQLGWKAGDPQMKGNALPFILAHDIGHFLAAPMTDLGKPNIGLPSTTEECADAELGPGMRHTIYEEEAIINQLTLLNHLEIGGYNKRVLEFVITGLFKADLKAVRAGVAEAAYPRLISTLEERLRYIAVEEPVEVSLEDGLAALLGL